MLFVQVIDRLSLLKVLAKIVAFTLSLYYQNEENVVPIVVIGKKSHLMVSVETVQYIPVLKTKTVSVKATNVVKMKGTS